MSRTLGKPRKPGILNEENPCPQGANDNRDEQGQPHGERPMDQLAESATQLQCSECGEQDPQGLVGEDGASVPSNVIRIQEPPCSSLSANPLKRAQCNESDAHDNEANDHMRTPSCKIRKNISDRSAAKRGRQDAEDDRAQILGTGLPPLRDTQAQDDCAAELPPSRVRKLNKHDLSVDERRRGRGNKRKLDQRLDAGQGRICFPRKMPVQRNNSPGPSSEVLGAAELPSTVPVLGGQQQNSVQQARATRAEPLRGAPGPDL